jgi:hypothetical protein
MISTSDSLCAFVHSKLVQSKRMNRIESINSIVQVHLNRAGGVQTWMLSEITGLRWRLADAAVISFHMGVFGDHRIDSFFEWMLLLAILLLK